MLSNIFIFFYRNCVKRLFNSSKVQMFCNSLIRIHTFLFKKSDFQAERISSVHWYFLQTVIFVSVVPVFRFNQSLFIIATYICSAQSLCYLIFINIHAPLLIYSNCAMNRFYSRTYLLKLTKLFILYYPSQVLSNAKSGDSRLRFPGLYLMLFVKLPSLLWR